MDSVLLQYNLEERKSLKSSIECNVTTNVMKDRCLNNLAIRKICLLISSCKLTEENNLTTLVQQVV